MGSSAIEVDLDVRLQNAAQLSLAEYEHVVEALSAHRTQEAFADGTQIGRTRRDPHNFDARPLGHGGEPLPELVIVVSDEVVPPINSIPLKNLDCLCLTRRLSRLCYAYFNHYSGRLSPYFIPIAPSLWKTWHSVILRIGLK